MLVLLLDVSRVLQVLGLLLDVSSVPQVLELLLLEVFKVLRELELSGMVVSEEAFVGADEQTSLPL